MTNARQKRNKSGFTLIEVIIVIAVLGILAMIAIPRYAGFTLEAKNKVDISNARIMTGIAAAYSAENGSYPAWAASFDEMVVDGTTPAKEYFSGNVKIQNPANSFEYDSSTGIVTVSGTGVVIPPIVPAADATLSVLTTSAGSLTPAFSSGVTSYSVSLPVGTTIPPTISASVKVTGAIASVSDSSSLPGSGTVIVTSKDGTATKTYTVSFTVASAPTPIVYTITFKNYDGSIISSITDAVGTTVVAPVAPPREGYTFSGWSPSVPAMMPEGGMTLTAQWSQIISFAAQSASGTNSSFTVILNKNIASVSAKPSNTNPAGVNNNSVTISKSSNFSNGDYSLTVTDIDGNVLNVQLRKNGTNWILQ
jgi:prepilin-type N-terminal cleavage/methylation domain-containing protein